MAPAQPPRPDKERRIKAILSFAANLEAQLPKAASSRQQGALFEDLQKTVLSFPTNLHQSVASKCEAIDSNGTTLWNLCTRLRRSYESDKPQDVPIILLMARIFAFLLLDCALEGGKSTSANTLRLMKIGIKAAKSCIDLALKVLEKLGGYELKLRKQDADSPPEDRVYERLTAEYYVLRTALAWHQDQLDIAEHMYNTSLSSQQIFDPTTTESLADVLYEMGKDLLGKQQYTMAVKWLERAFDVLKGQDLERLSMDASELRLSIIESLVRALFGLKGKEAADRAHGLVNLLENEVGDKLIVLLLRLELISSATNENFDSCLYGDVLQRITRTVVLSAENFKLVMYHIRKLNDKSSSLACKVLDDLLKMRVLKDGKVEWLEKILVTRLYMTTGQRDNVEALVVLEGLLMLIVDSVKQPISSAATLAAHTLLWQRIESNYSQRHYDMAERWCRLALHAVFENSGELNAARISRKLLLCALSQQNFNGARDIFGSMSDAAKNEPMTRFLMYKIAIRCEEIEFAAECLELISSSSSTDPTLLYACVLDAQKIGNRSQTLAALQLVLEKSGYGASNTIHLPSLLRLTIKFTMTILDKSNKVEGSSATDDAVEKLCKLFEGGVFSMRKAPMPAQAVETIIWTVPELDWFSKNSYNLSIRYLSSWTPRHSWRMLQCCIAFIDQYPPDISEQISDDLLLRKMFCEFSASTALVALARGEDIIETQLQDYLNLRKHVASFDTLLEKKLGKLEEGIAEDLLQKLSVLIAFDFEAACQLKAWDDLGETILKAEVCKEMRVYELMADCMLSSQAPTEVMVTTLKKIINQAWGLESLDSVKLAKYMRCLFQIALSGDSDITEQLIVQIKNLAEEAAETEQPYPVEEIEWIATRAFNHAVDLYCRGDDEGCKNWAGQALNIAHFGTDGGDLERLLQSKLLGLKFDGQ